MGHWLGLLHTFEPAYSALGGTLGGCVGEGDFVDDTPAELSANSDFCDDATRKQMS